MPVIDGVVIPADPEEMLTKGSLHRLPTFTGHTKEEGAFFYRCKLYFIFSFNAYSELPLFMLQ